MDDELSNRSEAIGQVATGLVTEARSKADSVLNDARQLEDRKQTSEGSKHDLRTERAKEDEILETARVGADAMARDEREQRQVALASLLAYERRDTDLLLEVERQRADLALAKREDFMAMVSHDLRNLLGGIALSAELLNSLDPHDEPFAKVALYAGRIQRFSARMSRLVGDLMDVASIEAGRLCLLRIRRHAGMLMRDADDAFGPAAIAQGIELHSARGASLGVVELDHERILQVLTNLVGNALKFTPRGGQIKLAVERSGDDLRFSVTDSGTGIAPDLLNRIFERHYQALTHDRRGLGLGLFISRSIVEAHGGRLWAESTPDQGSTFWFSVPAPVVETRSEASGSVSDPDLQLAKLT